MGPRASIVLAFRKGLTFSGRASRSEFLWFAGSCAVVFVALYILQSQFWGWTLKNGPTTELLTSIFHLIIALPFLALMVRRAQDVGLHPAIIFLPVFVDYLRFVLLRDISMDIETIDHESLANARRASFENPIGKIATWKWGGVGQATNLVVIILMLLPTNFMDRFGYFSSSGKSK